MKNLTALALLWLLALVPALAQTASEVRTLAAFQALDVSSGIEVTLTAGPTQRVEVSADTPEILARLETEVADGVLKLTFDRQLTEAWGKKNFIKNLRVRITSAPLTGIEAKSGSKVDVPNAYAVNDFALAVASGATVTAPVFTATSVQAKVSSGGIANLNGKVQSLSVQASSGGVFRGPDVQAGTCEAKASSGGSIAIGTQDKLTADASSGGSVRYAGSPQLTKHTSSGGSVRSR